MLLLSPFGSDAEARIANLGLPGDMPVELPRTSMKAVPTLDGMDDGRSPERCGRGMGAGWMRGNGLSVMGRLACDSAVAQAWLSGQV